MLTWAEIDAAVAARWTVARRSDSALLVICDVDGHRQKVLVETAAARDRPAVIVVAEIASGRLFPPDKALEYNAVAEHGALALARGVLVLRQRLPLEALELASVESAVRAAAAEATRIHRLVVRPAAQDEATTSAFGHLAD